ncbi:cilia- and flagella-associated protein 65-like [Convolutriloba macropyga]|uniref:cilia- and flagella-associated protein 65-like n=1 Tax=Convolutriloba macropyga TaxID=536237 RepID=UPI003F51EAAC
MVAENKLYKVHPQSGTLQPGQSVGITFTYQHLFPGTNRIPVLLKLNRGREIVLNFVGVTVEPQRRYLHFASPVHQFRPVPIAGTEPPQQFSDLPNLELYEFYNGGSVPLKCSLDLTALDSCKSENFNCSIFECLDKELYIEPGRSCALRWIFRPVEAKLYSVEVPVIIEDGETALIYFEGMGYDKREIGERGVENQEDTLDSIPTRQIVSKPRQEVFLSEERVKFGDLPLFTRGRRIVCLSNTSYTDTIKFEWQPNNDPHSKCVRISPLNGSLGPMESCMFRVTFTSTGFPSFYNLDFTCQIVNSSQMARYEWDLDYWKQIKSQQEQEFTITERNVSEIKRIGVGSGGRSNSCGGNGSGSGGEAGGGSGQLRHVRLKNATPPLTPSDLDFKHYETLPPIKKTRGDKDHRKSNRRPREIVTEDGCELWMKPIAPKPFVLHLGVTARTHNVQEFEETFGTVSSFFVDRYIDSPHL